MKKIICVTLLLLSGALLFAEIPIPYFGGSSLGFEAQTTFGVDLNEKTNGLVTSVGFGLWLEFIGYADRGIVPRRDTWSVSLKMANTVFPSWRDYPWNTNMGGEGDINPNWGINDIKTDTYFDTFIAQLEYDKYWVRFAGIEPEVALSQASIRSVFDPVMSERTAGHKNLVPLPLFNAGSTPYNGQGGIVSVIGRDLVHLNSREVPIAGNLSAGMKLDIVDLTFKIGSWKTAERNEENSWVAGGDVLWRPTLLHTLNFSFLTAINYGTITVHKQDHQSQPDGEGSVMNDPMASNDALTENPLAFGLGFDYRIDLPRQMIMKPYLGADFVYETKSNEYNWEIGGGLQWHFRGTSAQNKRNTNIGGLRLGDKDNPVGLFLGMNINKDYIINGIVSLNEDPHSSLIPKLGGFFQVELMNIAGKDYIAPDNLNYNDFLWAGIVQVEYLAHKKIMPYIFAKYIPADMPVNPGDHPAYNKDFIHLTSKLGCYFTLIDYFSVDVWYERIDFNDSYEWVNNRNLLSVSFKIAI
jgi:hypothetical protein